MQIAARNMLTAQSFQLTAAERADLTAKADRFREITGTTELTRMNVDVVDLCRPDVVIGQLSYML